MTIDEAIATCKKFLGCQKRLRLCNGQCERCSWDYTDRELIKSVKVLLIERQGKIETP